ncbi:MAG: prolipoprotein diacylglyceryl transferase [Dehalococcoidia bacterium]|nr:prolipoprotein diacylglyceryl transferase [Dehalococcoidia bacterium]
MSTAAKMAELLGGLADRMDYVLSQVRLLLLYSDLVILLVAYWIVAHLAKRRAPREGLPSAAVADLSFWLAVSAVVAARLVYILPDWIIYLRYPLDVLRIQTGLSFYGGLGGAILAGWWYARKARLSFWQLADLYAPYLPLGIAAQRLSCIITNICYGRLADPPFGIVFPGLSQPRYPAELYEMALLLALFGLLLRIRARTSFAGQAFLLFLVVYPSIHAVVDAFRITLDTFWVSRDQIASITVSLVAIVVWGWRVSHRTPGAAERVA